EGGHQRRPQNSQGVPRLQFLVPDRSGLPPLDRYATLQMPDGTRKVVGSTDASRGCKHLCRHCPVVPIYGGQFRVVSPDVVAADVAALVAAGAEHITFGDPDFLNGPTHAMRIVSALHAAHPTVSYDVTIKIEHLLQHRDLLPRLVETGCAFVTSAVESIDDRVLALLDKGHTRADFIEAVALCRDAGVALVPTFVAFHPWLTVEDYGDLVDTLEALDLVEHVAPIQLAIRLLVPEGSRLLELEEFRQRIGRFDPATLTYRWSNADPRVEELHRDVTALVGARPTAARGAVFDEISALAHARAGTAQRPRPRVGSGHPVPYLSEPWYCCAEPNPEQVTLV
ncbi:MAG: radical SAM protein, partial [Vicinamibacterales bacterium]